MDAKSPRKLIVLAIVTLFVLSLFHFTPVIGQTLPTDLSGIDIALYYGDPSSSTSSRTALQFMFNWMNASVDILYASDINDGELAGYDMIVVPGGWAGTYNVDLAGTGITEIRKFVRDGGSYFGVCAGAYFACDKLLWEGDVIEYPLNLFEGYGIGAVDEIAPWPTYAMAEIVTNRASTLIDLSEEPANYSVMYYGGPWFQLTDQEGIYTLATYSANNESAMIAFEYEEGRVFLSGPHPEWEEGSNRDGCTWENFFDDQGSEWDLMLKISLWLTEGFTTSTTTTTTSTDTINSQSGLIAPDSLLLIVALGSATLVIAILIRRRT